jgi:hypothetical protein
VPRFSLKRLLVSMTLIAIGIATFTYLFQFRAGKTSQPHINMTVFMALWTAGGAFIGAGLLTPLKRTVLGAALGFAIQYVLFVLALRFGW